MHTNLTIEALKALDAIDKKGSFAAAAESLFKVPSALTYTIKKLEQDVGVPLFDRSKQRAILTPAGQLVLEQGRDILLATHRLYDAVKQLDSGWEREIKIARDTIMCGEPLYDAVKEFVALDTNVNVSLSIEALAGGWDALHSGRADIVIGASGELPKGLYNTRKIGSARFIFAVAPYHPLAAVEAPIEGEMLLAFPSIVVSDSSQFLPSRDTGVFASKQVIRVNSMSAKLEAQVKGLGVGFVPYHLAQTCLQEGTLIEKQCSIPRPDQDLFLAWRKGQEGKALKWFIEALSRQQWNI